jgi:hypothetical protein
MSLRYFERLSNHVQEPGSDEHYAKIDGTHVTADEVHAILDDFTKQH